MTSWERVVDKNTGYHFYRKRNKLSNGQFCEIEFLEEYIIIDNRINYYVSFAIANKKKELNKWFNGKDSSINCETTGKCGLEGLLWAKNCIKEFEEYIWEIYGGYEGGVYIIVSGEDKRRYRVYERGLRDLGYEKWNRFGEWVLGKRVEGSVERMDEMDEMDNEFF